MLKQLLVRNLMLLSAISTISFMIGGNHSSFSLLKHSHAASIVPATPEHSSELSDGQAMYHVLAAEMYRLEGDDHNATLHYEQVFLGSSDAELARVTTETAAQTDRLDMAISAAKHWVSLDGDQIEARQYLALLLLRDQQFDASASQLHQIYETISEGEHDGLSFLASLISLESHQAQAYQAFETYVQNYNDTPLARLKLASVALQQGKYSQAGQLVASLKGGLTPQERAEADIILSKALFKQGRQEESLDMMGRLVASSKADNVSRLEFARLLMLSDDHQGAIDQLRMIHQSAPDNHEVLKSLVALYISQGQYVLAERHAHVLAENEAYESLAHHFLAEIYESRNEMDAALRAYRRVGAGEYYGSAQRRISELLVEQYSLEIAKEWLSAQREQAEFETQAHLFWRLEAELLTKYGDNSGALNAFGEAYQLDPNNSKMNYQYAIVSQSTGDIETAERLLLALIDREPDHAEAMNALGFMLLEHTDRIDDAAGHIIKANQIRPDDLAILDSLGWLKYKKGKIEEAIHLLSAAYEQSEDPEIASHLIEVMIVKGQQQEAKALLVHMIQQYPDDERLRSMQQK